jgi:transposase
VTRYLVLAIETPNAVGRRIDLGTKKPTKAIATRYDKRAKNFLGAIYLAAVVIWLN